MDFAEQLVAELDEAECWPLNREREAHRKVRKGIALRKGQAEHLRALHGQHGGQRWREERDYVCDPLAKRIAFGFADFLFADEPAITAPIADGQEGDEATQAELDAIIEANRLGSSLHRAERGVVSEGERYWKLHVNTGVAAVPLLTWSSRLTTVPLFYGDRLLAAAFVTERAREIAKGEDGYLDSTLPAIVWRHVEVHADGRVLNLLYRGSDELLGTREPLEARRETTDLNPDWAHGLPMLAGRVVNDLDDDDTLGVSEYDQIESMLLALNRAMTISVENCDLTGQDRIFVAGKFRQLDGNFDASMQIYELDPNEETELGAGGSSPSIFGVEKHYDAEPLWLHIGNLVKAIVRSVGLVPQWIGEQADGQAESGTAVRLRFIPTTNAAKGKTREWMDTLPRMLSLMLQVIALPVAAGGFGRGKAPEIEPSVQFGDPLPADNGEVTVDVTTAVAGEVMSRRTGVKVLHPSWSDDQVDEELDEIREDTGQAEPTEWPPPVE